MLWLPLVLPLLLLSLLPLPRSSVAAASLDLSAVQKRLLLRMLALLPRLWMLPCCPQRCSCCCHSRRCCSLLHKGSHISNGSHRSGTGCSCRRRCCSSYLLRLTQQ